MNESSQPGVPRAPATSLVAPRLVEGPGAERVGDATTVPIAGGKFLPNAGVFAERQAHVVAKNIADELAGRAPTARFDGKGACFLELGDHRAAFASGDFYAADAPAMNLHRPGPHWHLAKVALEKYWLRRWAA